MAGSIFTDIKCLKSLWEHDVIYVTGHMVCIGSNVLLFLIFYSGLALTNVSKVAFLYHLTDPEEDAFISFNLQANYHSHNAHVQ